MATARFRGPTSNRRRSQRASISAAQSGCRPPTPWPDSTKSSLPRLAVRPSHQLRCHTTGWEITLTHRNPVSRRAARTAARARTSAVTSVTKCACRSPPSREPSLRREELSPRPPRSVGERAAAAGSVRATRSAACEATRAAPRADRGRTRGFRRCSSDAGSLRWRARLPACLSATPRGACHLCRPLATFLGPPLGADGRS